MFLSAQSNDTKVPQRLPEEEASKQTEMLCRELSITDSVQRNRLYTMYLKYAQLRQMSLTRQEALERMMAQAQELKTILSEEQYSRFMNKQVNPAPRRPHQPYGQKPVMSIPAQDRHTPSTPPANRP